MSASLISLIGPPGSGKTTVARWLADALGGDLICEDYAGNPFLAESYAGRDELRLAGQIWFLLSRVNQLARAHWTPDRCAVSDYAFVQDRIYAGIWLAGAELADYESLARRVAPLVQPPEVLICLDGPVELLADRIAGRGRGYETHFTREFLQQLRQACLAACDQTDAAVLKVDIAQRDLSQPDEQQWLIEQVEQLRQVVR